MDWFNSHIEIIVYVAGAVLTFTVWNVNQGNKNKETAKDLASYKEIVASRLATFESDLKSIRDRQDTVERGLTDELRKIGEKLAHIEGYLTAKRQTKRL